MAVLTEAFRAQRGEGLFNAYRLVWTAGFALMFFVNFHTAPLAEWTDRDQAVAAVRLGLKIPAYPSPSPAGEVVFAFGATGKTLALKGGEHLIAVNERPMPVDGAGRAAAMSGPDGETVTLTFRRGDGSIHSERIVRSPLSDTASHRDGEVSRSRHDAAFFGAQLERNRKDDVFPIRVPLKAGGAIGWLLVGPRPDGSMSSHDEPEVLVKIAKPVARSVAIARTREALTDEHRQIIAVLQQAVAGLESRVQRLEPRHSPQGAV